MKKKQFIPYFFIGQIVIVLAHWELDQFSFLKGMGSRLSLVISD